MGRGFTGSRFASGQAPGSVDTTAILDGTIVNADIAAAAEVAVSKLADGAARQLLQTDAAGTDVEWTSNIDIPGTLDVTGAATFDSTATFAGVATFDAAPIIDVDGTEALLVRKDSDGGDVFIVDTTNTRVGIGGAPTARFECFHNQNATSNFYFRNTDTTDTNSRANVGIVAGSVSMNLLVIHNDHCYLNASSGSNIAMQINSTSFATFGHSAAGSLLVQPSATGAKPVLELDQDDSDQPFIEFDGTASANATDSISTLTTSGAVTHHIQITINGTKAWIPASTTNPS